MGPILYFKVEKIVLSPYRKPLSNHLGGPSSHIGGIVIWNGIRSKFEGSAASRHCYFEYFLFVLAACSPGTAGKHFEPESGETDPMAGNSKAENALPDSDPFRAGSYRLESCSLQSLETCDIEAVATLLAAVDPWLTLGYSREQLQRYLLRPDPSLRRFSMFANRATPAGILCIRYPWLLGAYIENDRRFRPPTGAWGRARDNRMGFGSDSPRIAQSVGACFFLQPARKGLLFPDGFRRDRPAGRSRETRL